MKNVIDFRSVSVSSIVTDIRGFKKPGESYTALLNAYLHIAVWHSIKDGQYTPALNLLPSVMPQLKESVSLYLTKYGFLRLEKGAIEYNATKGNELIREAKAAVGSDNIQAFRLMRANEVFESLPSLDEAFPKKAKQYKDIPLVDAYKALVARIKETESEGHCALGDDTAKKILEDMRVYVASFAK